MKKLFVIAAIVLGTAGFSACGGENKTEATETTTETTADTSAAMTDTTATMADTTVADSAQ